MVPCRTMPLVRLLADCRLASLRVVEVPWSICLFQIRPCKYLTLMLLPTWILPWVCLGGFRDSALLLPSLDGGHQLCYQ
ncbi:uncharacterized protein BP01DRAFT_134233 [Aspergillus saccharolyticus JOP 1030-1]|uniref:Uncharacterized protein n=1 Tax=Aspergillus saccharolyticus JOP 1030-1 TaxID=1450539 RepID=A0A318ZR56_9EURO|nr:hypothetical protein BP01DRAFT_134233 [Aspergillus saccharolyticus JOP 1030-1]PYH42578.1 hypothetical protein BP01DRAFT_134233 [Aspergillus saccharolyticus JOP 1030-1]